MSAGGITGRLAAAAAGLTGRERLLLALLAAVAVPLCVVFLWILPTIESNRAVRSDLSEARALLDWVAARDAEAAAQQARATQVVEDARAPVGISGIERSLAEAGLRRAVTRLANRESGTVELGFDSVGFTLLSPWLDRIDTELGYRLSAFRIERGGGFDEVRAEFTLEPGT